MTRSKLTRIAAAAAAATTLAVAAADASAAQRYAAPGATNGWPPCAAANPCALKTAVEQAANGDEVILLPGDYGSQYEPMIEGLTVAARDVTIRAQAGKPKPRLWFATQYALSVSCTAHLRDLELRNVGSGVTLNNNAGCATGQATADRLAVYTSGPLPACSVRGGSILRNSVCHSAGGRAVELSSAVSQAGIVRHVTAVATGPGSSGIRVQANSPNPIHVSLHVLNSIARAAGPDLVADTNGPGKAELRIGHSNYSNLGQSGNGVILFDPVGSLQTAAPLFANLAGGDLHQAAGSPTIDAGVQTPSGGLLDIDGEPRLQGAAVDLGADERAPDGASSAPPASPPPPQPGGSAPADAPSASPPLLTDVSLSKLRWRARRPARVRFTLAAVADVRVKLVRLRRARRPRPAGELTRADTLAGTHSLRLPRRLAPGRYGLRVTAAGGLATARSALIRFRITAG